MRFRASPGEVLVRVEDLSEAEHALWDAFPLAGTVDLRAGDAAEDDPAGGGTWGQHRSVRAEVVAALLLGAQTAEPGRVPAVRLSGARITGSMDLAFAEVAHAVLLQECFFDEAPDLYGAHTRLVNFSRSCLPGLSLSDAYIDGMLVLGGCHFDGPVYLTGTQVAGTLFMKGTELRGDPALRAESMTVGRDMMCAGMVATGACLLWSARVAGTLILDGARLSHPGGTALTADGLIAERGIFCRQAFEADGEVRFQNARIGQHFTMAGALLRNQDGTALSAEGLIVDGALHLSDGFSAEGEVLLRGSTVRGEVHLAGAKLSNPPGAALNANRATIEGGVNAGGGFTAHGEVALADAHIRGSLNLSGASLRNTGGIALLAPSMEVTERLVCGDGFTAEGEIRLVDARVGGSVYFAGSRLSNAPGRTLRAWGLATGGVVDCGSGFAADGLISFAHAHIGSELRFNDATVRADVHLHRMHAAALITDADTVIDGTLDMRHVAIEVLQDDQVGLGARGPLGRVHLRHPRGAAEGRRPAAMAGP